MKMQGKVTENRLRAGDASVKEPPKGMLEIVW
jgi:hypothetical protein